ncbi:MAG: hypothetical protein MZV63_13640 [Marinilabiliales bacterium]|nr:hypothetical protein [Marinilabiliales bacterium]
MVFRSGRRRGRSPGLPQVRRRRGRQSPPFRRADHVRRSAAAKMPSSRRGLLGRSLGRPADLSLDLVRDRQPGEGPLGRLFLRDRSRGPIRAPDRRRADGWQECRSDVGCRSTPGTISSARSIRPPGIKLYLNGKLVGEKSRRRAARLRAGGRRLDRAQPDASRSQRGDPGRRAGGLLVRRDHRRGPDLRRRPGSRPRPRRRSPRLTPSGPSPLGPPVLPVGTERAGPLRGLLHAAPVRRGMGESLARRRRRRRRGPFRRDAEPARLLARHELHPRLGHRERHLVHQRILRDPGPDDADERRAHGRQAGPFLASPDPREQRRPGRRALALRAGQRQLRSRQRRSADGVGRLGRGDLHRLPRRLVRPQDQGLVVQAAARSGRGQGME